MPERSASDEPVPPALATLVRECLEKEPELRPQSAAEVASRLEAIYERLNRTPKSRHRVREAAEAVRELPMWIKVIGIAVFGLGVLALWPRPRTITNDDAPVIVIKPTVPASFVKLVLQTDPDNADVIRTDTGERLGRTPLTITVPRGSTTVKLRFLHAGYQAAEIELPQTGDATAHVSLRPAISRRGRVPARRGR